MNHNRSRTELEALQDAALSDLMSISDADLRREAAADGLDLAAAATQMRADMREAAAKTLRERLVSARKRALPTVVGGNSLSQRPTLDVIKQLVGDLFKRDPSLGLAFRDGKSQSDADWLSLYDDLLSMGAFCPKSDDH